jgi:hypothetical protein
MAEVTYYVALPFVASDDGVAACEPTECFNPIAADSSEVENALTMLRCQRLRGRLPSFEDSHRFPLNLLTASLGVLRIQPP